MSRQILIKAIAETIRNKFSLNTIRGFNRMLGAGELEGVLSDAIEKAVLDQLAQDWQNNQDVRRTEDKQ
jgi:hypothetical protein